MRRFLNFLLTLCFSSFVFAAESKSEQASDIEDLKRRMTELEEKNKTLEDWYSNFYLLGKGRMSPFLGETISFGGYLETAIIQIYGPDTPRQTSAYSNVFGLNITAEFTPNIRLVAQGVLYNSHALANMQNNPKATPSQRKFATFIFSGLISQGYVEIQSNENFVTQIGLGAVPFGHAYQQREPTLFHSRGGPQMINQNDTVTISNIFWSGIHFLGLLPLSEKSAGYDLYTLTPTVQSDVLGVGGRLWWAPTQNIVAGASVQNGIMYKATYLSHGLDVEIKSPLGGLITEYAYVNYSGDVPDTESYYFEPYLKFYNEHWILYGRWDYLSFPSRTLGPLPDPTKKLMKSVGVNWLPIPNVRLRFGYTNHDYVDDTDTIFGQRRDYVSYEFSAVTAF